MSMSTKHKSIYLIQNTFSWICSLITFISLIGLFIELTSMLYALEINNFRLVLRSLHILFSATMWLIIVMKDLKSQTLEQIAPVYILFNFVFSSLFLIYSPIDFTISSLTFLIQACFYLFTFSFFIKNQISIALFGIAMMVLSVVNLFILKPSLFESKYTSNEVFQIFLVIMPLGILIFTILFAFNRRIASLIIKEIHEQAQKLEKIAFSDQVTGIPNALQLTKDIQQYEAKANFKTAQCVMTGFHLEGLEAINETQGFEFANRLLKELASVYQNNLKTAREGMFGFEILEDFNPLYRIESNTFISLLKITEKDLFEPQRKSILQETIKEVTSQFSDKIILTFRGGFSSFPEDAHNLNQLLKNILNLVHSPNNNIATFAPFDHTSYKQYLRKDTIKTAILPGITKKEFRLVYQPKILVSNNAVFGFEALARWTSSEHGIISPAEFIPLAEETGSITDLTNYLFDEALLFSKELSESGIYCPISINLSPGTICPNFIEYLTEKLEDSGLSTLIEFEITEGIVMKMTTEISSTFRKLKNLGVSFSIDDFGTGYSNLGYLQSFDAEVLKIDKSFIDGIEFSDNTKKLVKTIIQMGKTFGMNVVAEGVETAEQRDFLAMHGCDIIQGYFYSKPLESHDAIDYLKAQAVAAMA